jgi:hypothetical protein
LAVYTYNSYKRLEKGEVDMYRSGKGLRKTAFFLVFLVSVLLVSGSGYAADRSFWQERQKKVQDVKGAVDAEKSTKGPIETAQPAQTVQDALSIRIPEQYGTIIETYNGTNGKLIVHIQDAHVNYEAQKNLSGILESLIEDEGLNLIMQEGRDSEKSPSALRKTASLDVRKTAAENLLKNADISGEDYLVLTSDYPLSFYGIEDMDLYNDNKNALWEMDKFKDMATEYVDKLIIASDAIKPRVYNKALLALDTKKKDYDAEKIDLVTYYGYLYEKAGEEDIPLYVFPNFGNLIKAIELEKKIDLLKVRDGSASSEELELYNEYTELTRNLNINELFKEEPMLQDALEDILARDPGQRNLIKISKALSIMKNLLRIKVVPEEYKYFIDNRKDFDPVFWADFLGKKSRELNLSLGMPNNHYIISDHLSEIEGFYAVAEERNNAFVKKAEQGMNKKDVKIAALIAGGFHTPKLTQLLVENGFSYVVISPKVTTSTDDVLYRKALKTR